MLRRAASHYNFRPIASSGLLIGAGMGGFIDGIVFHQILQWHNMFTAKIPVQTLADAKINMIWDGFFHLFVWALLAIGIARLWAAAGRADFPWSGRALFGSILAGWGVFNLVEGLINHHILGIHHVYDYGTNPFWLDVAFLLWGGIMLLIGGLIAASGRSAWRRNVTARADVVERREVVTTKNDSAYLG